MVKMKLWSRCKHTYNYIGSFECTFKYKDGLIENVPIYFYECIKCGKRKIIKDDDFLYRKTLLKEVKMWLKHEIEFDFGE